MLASAPPFVLYNSAWLRCADHSDSCGIKVEDESQPPDVSLTISYAVPHLLWCSAPARWYHWRAGSERRSAARATTPAVSGTLAGSVRDRLEAVANGVDRAQSVARPAHPSAMRVANDAARIMTNDAALFAGTCTHRAPSLSDRAHR
jgi:hypothetical protein